MDLAGHRKLTETAVKEFLAEYQGGTPSWNRGQMHYTFTGARGRRHTSGPADYVVQRDLIDVATLGHWSNFAQKHHFMRRQDEQSPFQAYIAAVLWIQNNALAFAQAAARGQGSTNLQKLGNACHAVEDSFADGHAVRRGMAVGTPGAISYVRIYAGDDKAKHEEGDEQWKNDPWAFELAKNAVKALLVVIFDSVLPARDANRPVTTLLGWDGFVRTWLRPSPNLAKDGAFGIDLIDLFTDGRELDEAGLAEAIYSELGTDTGEVLRVVQRLDRHDNSNVDDVVEIYVNKLRANPAGAVTQAVMQDRLLLEAMIKALDEGWTSAGEETCLVFLRELRKRLL